MHRVLAPGVIGVVSTPYGAHTKTLVRARVIENGDIEHLMEPEYHGDPVNGQGILAYYYFGIDLLDVYRNAGFSEVYAVQYFSIPLGHPTFAGQEYFVLVK